MIFTTFFDRSSYFIKKKESTRARTQDNKMGYLCPSHIPLPGAASLVRQKELRCHTVWDKLHRLVFTLSSSPDI